MLAVIMISLYPAVVSRMWEWSILMEDTMMGLIGARTRGREVFTLFCVLGDGMKEIEMIECFRCF